MTCVVKKCWEKVLSGSVGGGSVVKCFEGVL